MLSAPREAPQPPLRVPCLLHVPLELLPPVVLIFAVPIRKALLADLGVHVILPGFFIHIHI